MQFAVRRNVVGVIGTAALWAVTVVMVSGQAAPAAAPAAAQNPNTLRAEQVFKNVQVLRGTTVQEFMNAMGAFSIALGMSCEDCHSADDRNWAGFAAENPRKQRARMMVLMMQNINRTNFGGRQMITCYSCHRGDSVPKPTATMADVYGGFPPNNPPDIITQAQGAPTADSVFDKYFQAIGGTQRLAALKSYTAQGTSVGYGPEEEPRKVEVFAVAPDRRATIIHTTSGDATTVITPTAAWYAAPYRPVDVLEYTGQDLEAAKIDAIAGFPGSIKTAAANWRVGRPFALDGKDMVHVQGTTATGVNVSLYFDPDTNLLTRQLRFTDSPVGRIPTQIDYSDYRDVAGVKIPFKWTVSAISGRDSFELTQVQPNAQVPATRFNKPAAPKPITERPVNR
jgi:hypothetical protein